jgi:hypothetical protein
MWHFIRSAIIRSISFSGSSIQIDLAFGRLGSTLRMASFVQLVALLEETSIVIGTAIGMSKARIACNRKHAGE